MRKTPPASVNKIQESSNCRNLNLGNLGATLKDGLPFWSQFQKIDLDEDISPDYKFQYLVQAMMAGTRAREIVESFLLSCENYPKAVACLKARFG
jgi:hypothetical protein